MNKKLLFLVIISFFCALQITAANLISTSGENKEIMSKWSRTYDYNIDFSASPAGKLTFYARKNSAIATGKIDVYARATNGTEYKIKEIGIGDLDRSKYTQFSVDNVWSAAGVDKTTQFNRIRFHATGTLYKGIQTVVLAQPTYLESSRAKTSTVSTDAFKPVSLTSPIVINHCNMAKKLEVVETDATGFFTYVLTETNPSGPGKFGTVSLQVTYHPLEGGSHSATFKVWDGTNSITFTVNGTAARVSRSLTWDVSDKLRKGENVLADDVAHANFEEYGPWRGSDITYSSSDESVILVDGNNLYAVGDGEATITAHMAATVSYVELFDTKTISVTSKRLQEITWTQRFSYTTDNIGTVVTLDATATSDLPVTYNIAGDGTVATLSGNKLTITGEGRTTITAYQAGNDEFDEVELSKMVLVRDPDAACEEYVLADPTLYKVLTEISSFTGTEQEYVLDGRPAGTLTFSAMMVPYKLVIEYIAGNCHVDTYDKRDGESKYTWHEDYYTCSPEVKRDEYQTYSVELPRNTTRIKLTTNTGAMGYKYYKDVYVTQATYLESERDEITYSGNAGTTAKLYTYINYSNMPGPIEITSSDERFVRIETEPFGEGCGDWGRQLLTLNVTVPPSWTDRTYYVTLKASDDPLHQLQIPVKLKATGKGTQAIDWSVYPTLTTASDETTLGAHAKPSNYPITYTSSNPEIAYFEDGKLVILQRGKVTFTASQAGDEFYFPAEDITKTFTITEATLTFDNQEGDNDWFNPLNWKPTRKVIPNIISNAILESDIVISDHAYAKKLTLDGHHVTIDPNGYLNAKTIVGANKEKLFTLEPGDSKNKGGALATKTADVLANVGIYIEASKLGATATWQYFGVPFPIYAGYSFYKSWICEWKEPTGTWEYKNTEDILQPWVGYSITQPEKEEFYVDGVEGVVPTGDHTYTLSRNMTSKYPGQNLITNSYTAPIDISLLEESDFVNTEKTIYIYNTGSYEQWESNGTTTSPKTSLAGQYMAIPALEVDYSPYGMSVIPPMQAFFVVANSTSASLTIDYDRVIMDSKRDSEVKRAPQQRKAKSYTDENLIIQIDGSRFGDAVSVLKRDNCTENFDDGHDAEKWIGNTLAPQIYVIQKDNKIYSVDAVPSLVGQQLGLKKGEDDTYRITFKLVDTDDMLYLKDLSNNAYYPIIEGETIEVETLKNMSRRFMIVDEIGDDAYNDPGVATDIRQTNETAYLTNTSNKEINAVVYDMLGHVVSSSIVTPNATLEYDLTALPHGTYIISFGEQNLKVVR
ncbi:MAG: hypothetical protein IKN91_02400 [Paludibacteraceae bacterium]|nr:hypothetical protein [Paludibacteraceae bacterium]